MSNAAPAAASEDSFAALFEESLTRKEMRTGEVITAEVVRVDMNYVVVNAGLKSESFIALEEFKNDKGEVEVKPGDFTSVAIEALEDGYGETRLSRDKAKRLAAWLDLEKALEAGTLVKGMISGKVKGGLTVMTNGIRAFLPGSLVDIRPVKDTNPYEGKEMEFKVIKLDRKRNNVVVSRRAVLEASQGAERQALLANLQEGAVVKGIVKNITDYGAFVDLGGIDGLLHITDLAWRRVKHPSEVLNVGDEVTAKVLKFDTEKNRVSLGLKQLGEDPWVGLSRRYPTGTRLFGKVTNLTDYGAFVEVEQGIEGLVHVSEMDWTNKNVHPSKVVALGDEVEVMILEIDEERRRISLGMKQCLPNPWEEFSVNFKKGDKVKGQIKSITDFGIFIGLQGGIDGLVHLSDLSWTSSRSPTSAFSSGFRAGSTVWCTSRTCPGPCPGRRRCAISRKARRPRRRCCRSTSSASGFRSGSSSSKATLSTTSSRATKRASSSRAPSSRSTPRGRSSRWAATSRATCAPPRSHATASRTPATISRKATASRR